MKILLDECVPRKLKHSLVGHECETVPEADLAGKKNGELLSLAERLGFEVVLTVDKGVAYEQNFRGRRISVVIFHVKSNRLKDLMPHIPDCLTALATIRPGAVVRIPFSDL